MPKALRRAILTGLVLLGLLAAIFALGHRVLRGVTHEQVRAMLTTVLDAETVAVRKWAERVRDELRFVATEPRAVRLVERVVQGSPGESERALGELARALHAFSRRVDAAGFAVIDAEGAAHGWIDDEVVRFSAPLGTTPGLREAFHGEVRLNAPLRASQSVPDWRGRAWADSPAIYGMVAVERGGGPFAVLVVLLPSVVEFSELLGAAGPGRTGHTYAVDAEGRLASAYRHASSLLTDGGGSELAEAVVVGVQVLERGEERPILPVRLARELPAGLSLEGYDDIRGIRVVGAWRVLPELGVTLVSEMEREEAFRGLSILNFGFFGLSGMLALAMLGLVVYGYRASAMRSEVENARRLGPYQISSKLGAGGMGEVYRATHALLSRPTAIKFIDVLAAGREGLTRFEREAKMTAQLTHPNTIDVYDFGRTRDGVFYYAMELVEGYTFAALVGLEGPQPPGRVIYLLRQACGSLDEAHRAGLVHRDVKPSNLMISVRGGIHDFVKVLDFGLVRTIGARSGGAVAGTPLYMPPEAFTRPSEVDGRSDVYQLGLVAYFLLTGRDAFEDLTLPAIIEQQVELMPPPPSEVLGRALPTDLEAIVMTCLEKDPEARPTGAARLERMLARCVSASEWGEAQALAWWEAHPPRAEASETFASAATVAVDQSRSKTW